jgi:multicomponent Na+:H+ antiporter subunit D
MLIEAAILIPAIGAILIGLTGRQPNVREAVTLVSAVSMFIIVCQIYTALNAGDVLAVEILEVVPGLSLAFAVEPLGMLFALVASFLWIVTSIYSIGYMRGHHEQNQTRFYVCFALALSSVMGLTFSANMFTLFIFYELITLVTYPLVTHSGTDEAKRSGRVYLGVLLGTSIGLQLLAIVWTWTITGTLDFTEGGILAGKTTDIVIAILFALYVFGIGKAALMPFHRWLPAAMVAPTPVSALLHAVAVVKAGVFTVLKVTLYIFGIDLLATTGSSEWLIYVASATILIASIIAMSKDNLKARLAYSTVSQLAYIVLGAMLASTMGIIGSGMHIAMHAFGKITLFFCAGAIMVASHKTEISQMRGLGRTMPFTMMAFLIGSMSIIGLPPTGGMWSKWFLVMGTLEAEYYIPLLVLLISSLLNVAYLLPIAVRGFFSEPDDMSLENRAQGIKEAPLPCLIAIAITSLGCIALFFYPEPVYELMQSIAK